MKRSFIICTLPPNIIRMIKSRRIRMGIACSTHGEKRNAYRILVGKPEQKRPIGRHIRKGRIKMDLREIEWGVVDWIYLAQNRASGRLW
jgi:hypothetical protein